MSQRMPGKDIKVGPIHILAAPAEEPGIGVPGGRDIGGIGPLRVREPPQAEDREAGG